MPTRMSTATLCHHMHSLPHVMLHSYHTPPSCAHTTVLQSALPPVPFPVQFGGYVSGYLLSAAVSEHDPTSHSHTSMQGMQTTLVPLYTDNIPIPSSSSYHTSGFASSPTQHDQRPSSPSDSKQNTLTPFTATYACLASADVSRNPEWVTLNASHSTVVAV